MTDEDLAYKGGRFAEVRDAIFANPYQKTWGRAGEPPLPVYPVTLASVLTGILPFGQSCRTRGTPVFQRRTIENWRHIGRITFDNGVASYNGDFVIHFHHPAWRDDRNDPATTRHAPRGQGGVAPRRA